MYRLSYAYLRLNWLRTFIFRDSLVLDLWKSINLSHFSSKSSSLIKYGFEEKISMVCWWTCPWIKWTINHYLLLYSKRPFITEITQMAESIYMQKYKYKFKEKIRIVSWLICPWIPWTINHYTLLYWKKPLT